MGEAMCLVRVVFPSSSRPALAVAVRRRREVNVANMMRIKITRKTPVSGAFSGGSWVVFEVPSLADPLS